MQDYPKRGVVFRDITPLLSYGKAFSESIDALAERIPKQCDVIVGVEARGFIIGAALAQRLGIGFVPIRKQGKLPRGKVSVDYDLEYGSGTMEIHGDAFSERKNAVIADDLLATGGTAAAARALVEKTGGNALACAFIIELQGLGGRDRLQGIDIVALARY